MKKQLVHIKGTKEGLVLRLDDQCAYADLVEELSHKVSEGSIDGIVDVQLHLGNRYLSNEQQVELINIVENSGSMQVAKLHSDVIPIIESNEKLITEQYDTYVGIVRSGQVLKSAGDIIVIGDVNPNGQVEAVGNIYVLGNLRGIVHAGIEGNRDAIVAASQFKPTHVLIADSIEIMSNESPVVQNSSEQLFAYLNRDGIISYERLQEVRKIRPFFNKVKGGS
ncbi:septum site-determining protein MinC [Lysinibacillus endophyticus]|uniref:Probable septum site-determining protein MinC n=1 Tax=Ureibacillus endophyticus TaxID=1978490 RepID=A0A494ZDL7_9BACL|nr:septum site-determining protein MinC [Lysinibacillus endophyticus]MCP1145431.1 septum site-determining protein MinC [Lysinibacillus endophyticus]RKQ20175.1 septum site-determining protein MinC [Lysinibacillus endophyticus]